MYDPKKQLPVNRADEDKESDLLQTLDSIDDLDLKFR